MTRRGLTELPLQIAHDMRSQIEALSSSVAEILGVAESTYVGTLVARDFGLSFACPELSNQYQFATEGLELVGLDLLQRGQADVEVVHKAWTKLLWPAFRLRRTSIICGLHTPLHELVEEVIDGVLANRQPEVRLSLKDMDLGRPFSEAHVADWGNYVEAEILRAFLLLVRKERGFLDLDSALQAIQELRASQPDFEGPYLRVPGRESPFPEVYDKSARLVALYNLARVIEITGERLRGNRGTGTGGRLSSLGIKDEIDKGIFTARELLSGRIPDLRVLAQRLGAACKALVESSVFSAVMPRKTREFLWDLARRDHRPILELWYAQREALRQSLLDPTRLAIAMSMPTSSGKTLLAQLAIVQALADDSESKVVYLAPTRALVTQVSLTLKRDFAGRGIRVLVASPTFEINPVEDQVLKNEFNVLVTTPEKLDLLVRSSHESVTKLSLVIVDEAHGINDGERGARLELLLSTLRREREHLRFLLMTPFASNASELTRWLGGQEGAPIVIDWKPNDRLVGAIMPGHKKKNRPRELRLVSLDSAHSDCPRNQTVLLGNVMDGNGTTKEELALNAAIKWSKCKKGGILLLAGSRRSAEDRAKKIASMRPESGSRSVDIICRFLKAEAGGDYPLTSLLKKGVAFHHAGLSPEARYFVERLIEAGQVKVVCATTTLAQGVHFPLSVAIIESHIRWSPVKGHWAVSDMAPWEFWNIAGRVGRTLEDALGIVGFVATGDKQKDKIQEYLRRDASVVTSSLIEFIKSVGDREISFNTEFISSQKTASAFLQYVLHSLATAGELMDKVDLEGLIRASFVYQQISENDPHLAEDLIRLARQYVAQLGDKKGKTLHGFAQLADGTGFSSPSVDTIWREWRYDQTASRDSKDWAIQSLFPQDGSISPTLTKVMETLSHVPEIHLGTETEGDFSPQRIARITTCWVNGMSLAELAAREYRGDLLGCAHHVYGVIENMIPWGLRAVEKVAFAWEDKTTLPDLELLPAMVYHGVRSREAIALRMLNVPRIAAEGLADCWRKLANPPSVDNAESWIAGCTDDDWSKALPPNSPITGKECRMLWRILEGSDTWDGLVNSME